MSVRLPMSAHVDRQQEADLVNGHQVCRCVLDVFVEGHKLDLMRISAHVSSIQRRVLATFEWTNLKGPSIVSRSWVPMATNLRWRHKLWCSLSCKSMKDSYSRSFIGLARRRTALAK